MLRNGDGVKAEGERDRRGCYFAYHKRAEIAERPEKRERVSGPRVHSEW